METGKSRRVLNQDCMVSFVLFSLPCQPFNWSPALTCGIVLVKPPLAAVKPLVAVKPVKLQKQFSKDTNFVKI